MIIVMFFFYIIGQYFFSAIEQSPLFRLDSGKKVCKCIVIVFDIIRFLFDFVTLDRKHSLKGFRTPNPVVATVRPFVMVRQMDHNCFFFVR